MTSAARSYRFVFALGAGAALLSVLVGVGDSLRNERALPNLELGAGPYVQRLLEQGRNAEAIAHLETASRISFGDPALLGSFLKLSEKMGDRAAQERALDSWAALQPRNPEHRARLLQLLVTDLDPGRSGEADYPARAERAIAHAHTLLSLEPDTARAHTFLGLSLLARNVHGGDRGDAEVAAQHLRRSIELGDTNPLARQALALATQRGWLVMGPAVPAERWIGRSFVNPVFDYGLIGGVLSLGVAGVVLLIMPEWRNLGGVAALPAIVLASNSAHFASSTVRLYTKPGATVDYPFVAYGLPLTLLAVLAFCCLYPGDLGPHLNALYLTWSPYHYASQAYGLALMYCFRSGCRMSNGDRSLLRWTCLLPFLLVFTSGQGYGLDWLLRALPDAARTHSALYEVRVAVSVVLPTLCFAAPVALGIKVWRSKSGPMPLIALLMPITNSVWWVWMNIYDAFAWATIFHAIQYLAIIVIFHQRDQLAQPENRHGAAYHAVWFYAMSVGLGYALFYCLPRGYTFFGFGFTESMLLAFAAINIHHFIVDGFIWRVRRDQRNRQIVERGGIGAPVAV